MNYLFIVTSLSLMLFMIKTILLKTLKKAKPLYYNRYTKLISNGKFISEHYKFK